MRRHSFLSVLAVAMLCAACPPRHDSGAPTDAPAAASDARPLIELRAHGPQALDIHLSVGAASPRVAEVRIQLSSNLEGLSATPGPALTAAGKTLRMQREAGNVVRLVAFAADNTTPIPSGVLATLSLNRLDDGSATATVLTDRPILAPRQAQHGLQIHDEITF